jgi:hypothetical protein
VLAATWSAAFWLLLCDEPITAASLHDQPAQSMKMARDIAYM